MRPRRFRLIVLATTLAATLLVAAWLARHSPAEASSRGPERNGIPITSVLRREQDVFASTPLGLFRAKIADHRWRHVSPPASAGLDGILAGSGAASGRIYYVCRLGGGTNVAGLYASDDDGRSWHLILRRDSLRDIRATAHGNVFLCETTIVPGSAGEDRVLASDDQGRSWRTIASGLPGEFQIFPDPDHPDLICMKADDMILQAEDAGFRWRESRAPEWYAAHNLDDPAFRTHGCDRRLVATLATYFKHAFGDSAVLPGIDLVVDRPSYTFGTADPKRIGITVRFPTNGPPLSIMEGADDQRFWKLQIIGLDGRLVRDVRLDDRSHASAMRGPTSTFLSVSLGGPHPYHRFLNLGTLFRFRVPGTYRVNIEYSSLGIAHWQKGQWEGRFGSRRFTVTIVPGHAAEVLPLPADPAAPSPPFVPISAEVTERAAAGEVKEVEALIADGYSVNGFLGEPLVASIVHGRRDVALLLLAHGADPNATGGTASPALCCAAAIPDGAQALPIVKALIQHGANLDRRGFGGFTPLHSACFRGSPAVAEYLIAAGAEVNALDAAGNAPLHAAAFPADPAYHHPELVRILLDHGADVNAPNARGQTPLDLARLPGPAAVEPFEGTAVVIRLLEEHGARSGSAPGGAQSRPAAAPPRQ